jgi:hypothetical protein
MNIAWTILNGPSSQQWRNYKFKGPVFGCNYAYRDFPLTDLFVADRICVHNVRIDPLFPGGIHCYTKESPLELPHGWRQQRMPGIDSGTFAIEQAFIRYPNHKHVIIGADGLLQHNYETVYDYHFRKGASTRRSVHERYRKTLIDLLVLYHKDYIFISEHKDTEIRTQTLEAFRT